MCIRIHLIPIYLIPYSSNKKHLEKGSLGKESAPLPTAKAVHVFQDTLKGQMSEFAFSEQLPSTPTSHTQGPATVSSEEHSGLSLLARPWLRSNLGSTARCFRASSSSTALQPSGSVYLSHCFCSACFKLPTTPGHHSCGQLPHHQPLPISHDRCGAALSPAHRWLHHHKLLLQKHH